MGSWSTSSRGDEDRCAICGKGEGVHRTWEGRMVCGTCLVKSKANDVIELRRERSRRNKRGRS